MSLVVGRGDTGKLLTAVAAMLMYSTRLAAQHVMVRRRLSSVCLCYDSVD